MGVVLDEVVGMIVGRGVDVGVALGVGQLDEIKLGSGVRLGFGDSEGPDIGPGEGNPLGEPRMLIHTKPLPPP